MKTEHQPQVVPSLTAGRSPIAKWIIYLLVVIAIVAVIVVCTAGASGQADEPARPIFVTEMPVGYRDWKLISVAHEEGNLTDIRAILGNDIAVKAYREGTLPLPEGAIIARIAWSYEESEENNKAFAPFVKQGVQRSFVAGHPTNGVQFMVKDSNKYVATGGWGYAHFNEGKPASDTFMQNCYPCHKAAKSRDYVFARYAP